MANRLSEQYNWTILLIEAGTDGNIVSDTPILTPYLQQTKYNWGYVAQRQAGSCWGEFQRFNECRNIVRILILF